MPVDIEAGLLAYYIEVTVTVDEHEGLGVTIGMECSYLIRDAAKLIATKKVEAGVSYVLHPQLEATLASVSYSTARGLLMPILSQSLLKGLYLPVLDAGQVMGSEGIDLGELLGEK